MCYLESDAEFKHEIVVLIRLQTGFNKCAEMSSYDLNQESMFHVVLMQKKSLVAALDRTGENI